MGSAQGFLPIASRSNLRKLYRPVTVACIIVGGRHRVTIGRRLGLPSVHSAPIPVVQQPVVDRDRDVLAERDRDQRQLEPDDLRPQKLGAARRGRQRRVSGFPERTMTPTSANCSGAPRGHLSCLARTTAPPETFCKDAAQSHILNSSNTRPKA